MPKVASTCSFSSPRQTPVAYKVERELDTYTFDDLSEQECSAPIAGPSRPTQTRDEDPAHYRHICNPDCRKGWHVCAECGRGTRQSCNMKTHELRTHTKITFPCKYAWTGCTYRWVDPAAHTLHMKGVHGHIPSPRTYHHKSSRASSTASFASQLSERLSAVEITSELYSAPSSPSSSSTSSGRSSPSNWSSPASSDYAASPASSFDEEDNSLQNSRCDLQLDAITPSSFTGALDIDHFLSSELFTLQPSVPESLLSFSDMLAMPWPSYTTSATDSWF